MPLPWRLRVAGYLSFARRGFSFTPIAATTPVARLRTLGRRVPALRNPLERWLRAVAMTLAWPIGAAYDSLAAARALARTHSHIRFVPTLLDIYALALSRNIPPVEYRLYRLDDPVRRAELDQYLYWTDLPALAAVNARRGASSRDVQDKQRFAELCARHQLPHVPTLAVFDGGRQTMPDQPYTPDQPCIFVKSLRGRGSSGAARWTRKDDHYVDGAGVAVRPEDFSARLSGDCVVQPWLENHVSVAARTNGALACLRIVTALSRAGTELIWGMLVLPFGTLISSTGGIICRVERDGTVSRAIDVWSERDATHHPDTGAPLVGFTVPFWRESVSLVSRAHAVAFDRFFSLGWDVALTNDGPVLLEANAGWGAVHHQMLEGPIGRTAFSRLVEDELNECG